MVQTGSMCIVVMWSYRCLLKWVHFCLICVTASPLKNLEHLFTNKTTVLYILFFQHVSIVSLHCPSLLCSSLSDWWWFLIDSSDDLYCMSECLSWLSKCWKQIGNCSSILATLNSTDYIACQMKTITKCVSANNVMKL